MPKKDKMIELQDVSLPNPELSKEYDTSPRMHAVDSWKETAINIFLSERKFEYIKTSLLSGIMIFYNMVVSTRLILIEAGKDHVEWRKFNFLGVEGELPSAFYIFVIANMINFIIIFGSKLIEKYFSKKGSE